VDSLLNFLSMSDSDSIAHVGFQAPDPAELNKLFPGYEIQSLIATGGMGAVYCAVQKSLDRTVALKILPQEFSKDAAFCEGFEAEAKAMARLNHPNLIGVYDFGEIDGMLYIIMEFVKGKSIYHSANGRAIDPSEVIRMVTAVCNGLAHAHENGIIHRDIKPSNILLDLNAQPKIGDFGLARPIERKIQEGEEIFGTPHYTAPEVVDAPHSIDYRADIFSVGVMLHELLTGKLPANDPRPPSVISHCDRRFDEIVRKATQTAPSGRYLSAAEMAKDLALIASSPIKKAVRAPAPIGRGQVGPRVAAPLQRQQIIKPKSSSKAPAFLLFLVLAAAGAGVYLYLDGQKPPAITAPAIQSAPKVEPSPSSQATDDLAAETERDTTYDPIPRPTPIPESTDDEMPDDETTEEITEETVLEPTDIEPKFDVEEFFERGRNIMREKAKPALLTRNTSLKTNLIEMGKKLKRQARKLDIGRERTTERLEENLEFWSEEGGLIPGEAGRGLSMIPDVDEIFDEHLELQDEIESSFQQALSTHAATYIVGLEKQIERLKATNDPAAIELIEKEIDLTKTKKGHFAALMLGLDPDEMDTLDDSDSLDGLE